MGNNRKLVIYDGICMLCSRSISFLDRNDKKREFEYLTYFNDRARNLLAKFNIDFNSEQYIVYIRNNNCYTHSRAVLEILKDLGGLWSLAYIFVIIPPFIRNYAYKTIAKNRHSWFK